jgi:hypothetical protein
MTHAKANQIVKANGNKPILPGSKEMAAILYLATHVAKNKS